MDGEIEPPRFRPRAESGHSVSCRGLDRPPPLTFALFLRISNVIDADDLVGGITDRLIGGYVVFAENICLAVVSLVVSDFPNDRALGIEKRANGARPVSLLNVRRNPDEILTVLHKDGRCSAHLCNHAVDQIEVIVHLGYAEIERWSVQSSHAICSLHLGRP